MMTRHVARASADTVGTTDSPIPYRLAVEPDRCAGSTVLVSFEDDPCPTCGITPGVYDDGPVRRIREHDRPKPGDIIRVCYVPELVDDDPTLDVIVVETFADNDLNVRRVTDVGDATVWTICQQQISRGELTMRATR